jgi:hypothetical protein
MFPPIGIHRQLIQEYCNGVMRVHNVRNYAENSKMTERISMIIIAPVGAVYH